MQSHDKTDDCMATCTSTLEEMGGSELIQQGGFMAITQVIGALMGTERSLANTDQAADSVHEPMELSTM